jgi:hypothetical protein
MGALLPVMLSDAMVEGYLAGASAVVLGARFGVSSQSVYNALQRRGIAVRTRKAARRNRYQLDETAFDAITPESAYWVGFLMADGSVGDTRVELGLSLKDKDHLLAFRSFMRSGHTVLERRVHSPNGNEHRRVQLSFNSDRVVVALCRFGVVPRKSLVAKVSDELVGNRDFWRGVVDGDGSVGFSLDRGRRRGRLTLAGSGPLLRQFSDFVAETVGKQVKLIRQGRIFCVYLSGRRAAFVARLLYSGCSTALGRKREAASTMMEMYQ